jgi:hypothetical protein
MDINLGINSADREQLAQYSLLPVMPAMTQRLQIHEKDAWMLRSMLA